MSALSCMAVRLYAPFKAYTRIPLLFHLPFRYDNSLPSGIFIYSSFASKLREYQFVLANSPTKCLLLIVTHKIVLINLFCILMLRSNYATAFSLISHRFSGNFTQSGFDFRWLLKWVN